MISHTTDNLGNYLSFSFDGHGTYTPQEIIAALSDAQTLQAVLGELREAVTAARWYRDAWQHAESDAQTQRTRADDAERWAALLERERKRCE